MIGKRPIEKHGLVPPVVATKEELNSLYALQHKDKEYREAYRYLSLELNVRRAVKILEVYEEKIEKFKPGLVVEFKQVLDEFPSLSLEFGDKNIAFKRVVEMIHMFDLVMPTYIKPEDFEFTLTWYKHSK